MPLESYHNVAPSVGKGVFLAPSAWLVGDVTVADDVSFWFHSVARGDVNSIRVGARTNVQDGAVLHVTHERHPLRLGEDVVVGHGAILHGCTVEDGALVGIGARVLDGAVVEAGAQVGAGAVVASGTRVTAGHLALGVPARMTRPLRPEESAEIRAIAARYLEIKNEYRVRLGRGHG